MDDRFLSDALDRMVAGYFISQAIYVAAELSIADRLADGPRRPRSLHATSEHTIAHFIDCSVRSRASVCLPKMRTGGSLSRLWLICLRSDVPGSQRATVLMMVGQFYQAWGGLFDSVRTGKPAFETIYGRSFFEYLATNEDQAQIFDDAMTARNDRKTKAMLEAYDLAGIRVLADIGGGNGSTLMTVLKRYPEMRGILFDRPGVVERARAGIVREGLAGRCQIVGGDFLERIPEAADLYLMRHILHNWDNERAVIILSRVRDAMPDEATLLVVERVIPAGNEFLFGKIMDLNMLVMLGGIERTDDEFRQLFECAGLNLTQIVPTEAEVSVIEAHKT